MSSEQEREPRRQSKPTTFPKDKGKKKKKRKAQLEYSENLKGKSWDDWDLPVTIDDEKLQSTRANNFVKLFKFSKAPSIFAEKVTQLLPAALSHCGNYPQDDVLNITICKVCKKGFKTGSDLHKDCAEQAKAAAAAISSHKNKHSLGARLVESPNSLQKYDSPPILNGQLNKTSLKESHNKLSLIKCAGDKWDIKAKYTDLSPPSTKSIFEATVRSKPSTNSSGKTMAHTRKPDKSLVLKSDSKRSHSSLTIYSSSSDDEIISIPSTSNSSPVRLYVPPTRVNNEKLVQLDGKAQKRKSLPEKVEKDEVLPVKKTKIQKKNPTLVLKKLKTDEFVVASNDHQSSRGSRKSLNSSHQSRPVDLDQSHYQTNLNLSEESDSSPEYDNQTEVSEKSPTPDFSPISSTSFTVSSKSLTEDCRSSSQSESEEDNSQPLLSVGTPFGSDVHDAEEIEELTASPTDADVIELESLPKLNGILPLEDNVARAPRQVRTLSPCRTPTNNAEDVEANLVEHWSPALVTKMIGSQLKPEIIKRLIEKLKSLPKDGLNSKTLNALGLDKSPAASANSQVHTLVENTELYESKTSCEDLLAPSNNLRNAASSTMARANENSQFMNGIEPSYETNNFEPSHISKEYVRETSDTTERSPMNITLLKNNVSTSASVESQCSQSTVADNQNSTASVASTMESSNHIPQGDKKREPNLADPFSMEAILDCFRDYRDRLEEQARKQQSQVPTNESAKLIDPPPSSSTETISTDQPMETDSWIESFEESSVNDNQSLEEISIVPPKLHLPSDVIMSSQMESATSSPDALNPNIPDLEPLTSRFPSDSDSCNLSDLESPTPIFENDMNSPNINDMGAYIPGFSNDFDSCNISDWGSDQLVGCPDTKTTPRVSDWEPGKVNATTDKCSTISNWNSSLPLVNDSNNLESFTALNWTPPTSGLANELASSDVPDWSTISPTLQSAIDVQPYGSTDWSSPTLRSKLEPASCGSQFSEFSKVTGNELQPGNTSSCSSQSFSDFNKVTGNDLQPGNIRSCSSSQSFSEFNKVTANELQPGNIRSCSSSQSYSEFSKVITNELRPRNSQSCSSQSYSEANKATLNEMRPGNNQSCSSQSYSEANKAPMNELRPRNAMESYGSQSYAEFNKLLGSELRPGNTTGWNSGVTKTKSELIPSSAFPVSCSSQSFSEFNKVPGNEFRPGNTASCNYSQSSSEFNKIHGNEFLRHGNTSGWNSRIVKTKSELTPSTNFSALSHLSSRLTSSNSSCAQLAKKQKRLEPPWSNAVSLPTQSTPVSQVPNIVNWAQPSYSTPYVAQGIYNAQPRQALDSRMKQKQSLNSVKVQNRMAASTAVKETTWNWTTYGNNAVNSSSQSCQNSSQNSTPNWIQNLAEPPNTAPMPQFYPTPSVGMHLGNAPNEMYPPSPCNFQQQRSPVDQNNLSPISVVGWLEQQKQQQGNGQYPPPDYAAYANNPRLWNDPARTMNLQVYQNQRYAMYGTGAVTPAAQTVSYRVQPNFSASFNNMSSGERFSVQFASIPESIPSIPLYDTSATAPMMTQVETANQQSYQACQGQSQQQNQGLQPVYNYQYQNDMVDLKPTEPPVTINSPTEELPKFAMIDLSDGLLDYDFDFKFDT